MTSSWLYVGKVFHRRFGAVEHAFRYRVFSLLLDLDSIEEVTQNLRLFSHNHFNLFSFHDRDHGAGDGQTPKAWVAAQLEAAGIDLDGGSIKLLCFPRILGYTFNPLAIYYCFHRDGRLMAVLHQVSNTFGDRHSYLIPVDEAQQSAPLIHQSCRKGFYVSPFIDIAGDYRFRLRRPDKKLSVVIDHRQNGQPLLYASQSGVRQAITDARLLRLFFSHPLMTLKVMGAIHFEALKLWRRKVPFFRHTPPPIEPVTIVATMPPNHHADGAEASAEKMQEKVA